MDDKRKEHPFQEVAMAYDYLLSYLLLHVAAIHESAFHDTEAGESPFLRHLVRDIGLTSLSEEAKSWALHVVTDAEFNWKIAQDFVKERKPQEDKWVRG